MYYLLLIRSKFQVSCLRRQIMLLIFIYMFVTSNRTVVIKFMKMKIRNWFLYYLIKGNSQFVSLLTSNLSLIVQFV